MFRTGSWYGEVFLRNDYRGYFYNVEDTHTHKHTQTQQNWWLKKFGKVECCQIR